jgi:uncharacterized membrane protein YedE/YeeE
VTAQTLKLAFCGALLGFSLANMGFTSWDEVNAMFTFADLRLILTFGVGVVLLAIAFAIIRRRERPDWPPRPVHKGTLLGGVLFGLGWVVSGACPGVILAQIGEGKLYALFSLAGVLVGNACYGALLERRLGTRPPAANAAEASAVRS